MEWIKKYDLFLFDFDGLLVNTEKLHQKAYVRMCRQRGINLSWSFQRYCMAAHFEACGLRDQIYADHPKLYEQEPDWTILYKEKKKAYMDLLDEGAVDLMPGAKELLIAIEKTKRKYCVVTHSPIEQISMIRKRHPILDAIPRWFTRENYSHPKPHPECYEMAIRQLGEQGDRIIGFEDSPRGLKALKATEALAVFITQIRYPRMDEILKGNTAHYQSLSALLSSHVG